MARPKITSTKRARERAKTEKRMEKMSRREERKKDKENQSPLEAGHDPDIADIVPGPQPIYDPADQPVAAETTEPEKTAEPVPDPKPVPDSKPVPDPKPPQE